MQLLQTAPLVGMLQHLIFSVLMNMLQHLIFSVLMNMLQHLIFSVLMNMLQHLIFSVLMNMLQHLIFSVLMNIHAVIYCWVEYADSESRGSSVGIVSDYELDDRVSIPDRGRVFFF
jgi:hypothetical protein